MLAMFRFLSKWMLPAAPIVSLLIALLCWRQGLSAPASACAWVALTCAMWWIFECAHIAIVGLFPFAAFPLLGILDHGRVAQSYGHTMILLLMGGFFLSAAMEKSGAHRRLALSMVKAVGGRGGRRLVLGFMLATAMLSMWISNAATTLMILPIALAVLADANDPKLRTPLLLGIAYAASVGGMATPIGTPPNVYFMSFMQKEYGIEITFSQWMAIGLPISLCLFPAIWLWVTRSLTDAKPLTMPEVGRWRSSEVRVLIIFALTAAGWIFREGPLGGWAQFFPNGGKALGDTTVALVASMALFLCPSGDAKATSVESPDAGSGMLLDWPAATKIPWGILIMFGGGIALADGFSVTGLSESIGNQLVVFESAPPWVVVLSVCLLVTFLTEMTSSTATAILMMPILGGVAAATSMSPESVVVPGTISASCAFMLPVATAPNVIVFGAGGIRTDEMARNGFVMNLYAAGVITLLSLWLL